MTINTQELRDIGRAYEPVSHSLSRAIVEAADAIDLQAAEIARLRNAIRHLQVGFAAGRDNAAMMFGESGSMYHEGRRVAYDQAVADVRTALSGESNG